MRPHAVLCQVVESLTRSALEPLPLFASAEDGFMHALAQRHRHAIRAHCSLLDVMFAACCMLHAACCMLALRLPTSPAG